MVNSIVERATSSQLIGPDWAMNIEICDMLNHDPGQAKDVVKGIKKRMGSKNPKVQLLALTLLETIVKNCGDVVHMHVAEKDIPHEMVKIAKKKLDFQVKEKILTLIDTWQEAFGGPRARYPQYYAAYQELLRAGAVFPHKSESSAPVFTPPQTQPLSSYPPNLRNLNNRQETAEASSEAEYPSLSLTEIQNARGIMDVLAEMLNALDPANKQSLRQEVIVDLVEQCRTYKQRVMHLVNSTSDESLLCQGLALNDDLQKVLAKHEALLSGSSTGITQEKSKPESSKSLVHVDAPLVDTGASSKQADKRSTGGTIPAAPVNVSLATPIKAEPKIDLLSGDLLGDDFSSASPKDALALVPVSAHQPSTPVASQQNALALVDMFSAPSNTPGSLNSQPPTSTGQIYTQQQRNLQLPQSTPYANGMAAGMGLPQYEQSGYPQAAAASWNAQVAQQQPHSPAPDFNAFNPQVGQQLLQPLQPQQQLQLQLQPQQQQQQPQPQPQPPSAACGALNAQVTQQQLQPQPQSPVSGAHNGGTLPPPPWESQPAEINQPFSPTQPFSPNQPFIPNQPFSPNHPFSPQYPSMQVPSMAGQQSPTFQGGMHPFAPQPTGNDQVAGMYAQQMTGGHMPGMNAQHMPNQMPGVYAQPYQGVPTMGMGPQGMQAALMASMYPAQMYGNQMLGYGYGYVQQPDAQCLDQRMYGLSLRDDSSLRSGSTQNSIASYLPPMKQQPKGDVKLFGELVDMAKLKPTKPTTPNRTGSV